MAPTIIRSLLSVLAAGVVFAGTAPAQIVAVRLKDEKTEKKYKKHLVEYRGGLAVIGEASTNIVYLTDKRQIQWQQGANNDLFVADPADPSQVPYEYVDGERVPATKKSLLSISGTHIASLELISLEETLYGISREYALRTEQIDDARAARDREAQGSAAWNAQHLRVVALMERLRGWLDVNAFPLAAEKLAKEIERESKVVRADALRARSEAALASIRPAEVPAELVSLAESVSGGKDRFGAFESQHLRIFYVETVTPERVLEAMRTGEQVIEGFRAEFVDPYLDENYPDRIPDELFHEFLFVPEDVEKYEKYSTGFYGASFQQNRERRLAMTGGSETNKRRVRFVEYWKTRDDLDLPSVVTHRLGHSLAALHYSGRTNLQLDWLEEAMAYYLSFGFFGHNRVTCFAFDETKERYVKREREKQEGGKTVAEGRRDTYNEVALKEGRPIEQLALRELFEMDDADLCKAWSFFDYLARKEGKAGQEWLRAAGRFSPDRKKFIAEWRAAAAAILGVDPSAAFDAIEGRWRAYAEAGQDTSDAPRKH